MNRDDNTPLPIEIRQAAQDEIRETFRWYEDQEEGLGFEFMRALEDCLTYIRNNPNASPVVRQSSTVGRQTRRVLMQRFPYLLFYVVRDDFIFVIACLHTSRNPRSLRDRLNGF